MVATDFSAFLRLNFEANLSMSLRVYIRESNNDAIYLTYWDNIARETVSMDTEIGWLNVHVDAIKVFMLKQKRARACWFSGNGALGPGGGLAAGAVHRGHSASSTCVWCISD